MKRNVERSQKVAQARKMEHEQHSTHIREKHVMPAQREAVIHQAFRCANCDIEFFWSPTVVQDNIYCCTGCAAGGPCNCDYSLYRSVTILGATYDEQ